MPCDTIQTVTVQEELKDLDLDILKAALESMGFGVSVRKSCALEFSGYHDGIYYSGNYAMNKLTASSQQGQLNINSVKEAYSHQTIQHSVPSFGWKLTKTGKDTYEAVKQ
jgi:hypothetical protein